MAFSVKVLYNCQGLAFSSREAKMFRKVLWLIPGIWIIAFIYRLPSAKKTYAATSHRCVSSLPTETKEPIDNAFRVLKFVLIALLVVLYARIVYALWFNRSDNAVTHRQQVLTFLDFLSIACETLLMEKTPRSVTLRYCIW